MASALDMALQLTDLASRHPLDAVTHVEKIGRLLRRAQLEATTPPKAPAGDERIGAILERLERLATEAGGRTLAALGATHIVRLEDAPRLTQGSPDSGPHRLEWPAGEGTVRSLYAGTLDGDPLNLSRVSVRIAIDGTQEMFSTGAAAAYVPLIAFQAANHNWFRLSDYPVNSLQKWSVSFRYEGAQAGPPVVTPFLLFGFSRRH